MHLTAQVIERHDKENNPPRVDKRRANDAGTPPSIMIGELDDERMHALIGRRADHRNRTKPLLLYLWFSDCQPCRAHFNDVERLYREYHARGLDVVTVAVSPMDTKEKLLHYFAAAPPSVPIYLLKKLDDDLAEDIFQKDWEVIVPSIFGYDAKGRVVVMLTQIDGDYYSGLKKAAEQLVLPVSQDR